MYRIGQKVRISDYIVAQMYNIDYLSKVYTSDDDKLVLEKLKKIVHKLKLNDSWYGYIIEHSRKHCKIKLICNNIDFDFTTTYDGIFPIDIKNKPKVDND